MKTTQIDFRPWLHFFLRSLQTQKRHLEVKIQREQLITTSSLLSTQILALIQQHGQLTISSLAEMTGANRNTLKKHLAKLVKDQQLIRHGKGKATRYTAF